MEGLHLIVTSMVVAAVLAKEDHCLYSQDFVHAIETVPANYKQLQKLFFPINKAYPANAIIAYFTCADRLPSFCDDGQFPWKGFPHHFNHSLPAPGKDVWWVMWSTNPMNSIQAPIFMDSMSYGLVGVSYRVFFNRLSPMALPAPMACLAVPCHLGSSEASLKEQILMLGEATAQLYNVISPQKYIEQLTNSKYPGQYYTPLWRSTDIPTIDLRERMSIMLPWKDYIMIPIYNINFSFFTLMGLIAYGLPLILYKKQGVWLADFKKNLEHGKGLLAVFWAAAVFGLGYTWHTISRVLAIVCIDTQKHCEFDKNSSCATFTLAMDYSIGASAILSYVHGKSNALPPPKMIQVLLTCSRCKMTKRTEDLLNVLITILGLFGINLFTFNTLLFAPAQVFRISTNFYLMGTIIAGYELTLLLLLCLTSVVFTVDQAFNANLKYRLSKMEAVLQLGSLVMIFFLLLAAALFLFGIHLLLRLSKEGEKTQCMSITLFHLLSTLVSILMPKVVETLLDMIERGASRYFQNTLHVYSL